MRVFALRALFSIVSSSRHATTVADAVRSANIPVLGVVHRDEQLTLATRHLGLIDPADSASVRVYAALAQTVERAIDLDALVALASNVTPFAFEPVARMHQSATAVRVAIARDEAFWFYDESSLEAFVDAGAELIAFSPLRDPFPSVDAAIIGGGYPELHAAALAANRSARDPLQAAIHSGMPVYAECGGLMYLSRGLEVGDDVHPMVGAIPAISTMSARRSALRYVEATSVHDGPIFAAGQMVRGHEFHYSTTRFECDAPAFAIDESMEGFADSNVHASYVHVHLSAHRSAINRFLSRARTYASRAHSGAFAGSR
jgi:cobyrinic acid a,c-diamide synthase